jgi:hypothetical protein
MDRHERGREGDIQACFAHKPSKSMIAYAFALIASSIGLELGGARAAETIVVDRLANSGRRCVDFMVAG